MIQGIVYLLQVTCCIALLYSFYRLFMRHETYNQFNRILLLSILAISWILPLLKFSPMNFDISQGSTLVSLIPEVIITPQKIPQLQDATSGRAIWIIIVSILYLAGVCWNLGLLGWKIAGIYKIIRRGTPHQLSDGTRIVAVNKDIAPFSWMHYIVVSKQDYESKNELILLHEQAHIKKGHTWDMLFVELSLILQWFNPTLWLLKEDMQDIHEYQADKAVLHQGIDAKKYQLLLIKKAVGTDRYSIANSFNHSSLKKRITMMLKQKSSSWAYLKGLFVLPLVAIIALVMSCSGKSNQNNTDLTAKDTTNTVSMVKNDSGITADKEAVFEVCEQMPEFKGGMKSLMSYLTNNVKYPKEALDKSIQGRVVVQFIVNKDGTIVNPKVVRSVDPYLDKEAIRVVMAMPKWKPGTQRGEPCNVKYTIPIMFRLTDSGNKAKGNS